MADLPGGKRQRGGQWGEGGLLFTGERERERERKLGESDIRGHDGTVTETGGAVRESAGEWVRGGMRVMHVWEGQRLTAPAPTLQTF